jgi:hypothetical protein
MEKVSALAHDQMESPLDAAGRIYLSGYVISLIRHH